MPAPSSSSNAQSGPMDDNNLNYRSTLSLTHSILCDVISVDGKSDKTQNLSFSWIDLVYQNK